MTSNLNLFLLLRKSRLESVRCMGRYVQRNVIGVYKDEEELKETLKRRVKSQKKVGQERERAAQTHRDNLPTDLESLRYEKTNSNSRKNFANILKNMKGADYRDRHNMCLLHGTRLILQAMETGCYMRSIYFSQLKQLEPFPIEIVRKANLFHVPDHVFQNAHGGRREGLYALATQQDDITRKKLIKARKADKTTTYLPLSMVCCDIQDPRTMGDLLRTAAASGCSEVYVLEGCVDIWNMEVLKAANGAHFRIPVISISLAELQGMVVRMNPKKVIIAGDQQKPLTLKDVTGADFDTITSTSDLVEKIRQESKVETLKNILDLPSVTLPARDFSDVTIDTCSANLMLCGYMDYDLFELAANLRNNESDCYVLKFPLIGDSASFSMQAAVFMMQTRLQLLKKKEL